MTDIQFFAITDAGLRPLPLPPGAKGFADLYAGLPLGVYSAMRTFEHNKFLGLDEHLARTQRSLAVLGWEYEWDEARLRDAIHTAATAYPAADARVRFDILAAAAPEKLGCDSRELVALMPFNPIPPYYYVQGVGVDVDGTSQLSRKRPLAKTADFAEKRSLLAVGIKQDAYERLIIDPAGNLLEGTMTNFWAVRDGTVWTANAGILEGVTRKIILTLIEQMDISLCLAAYPLAQIDALDEAALSGSSRALLPVVAIDGQIIGNGRPGPISARILAAYNEYLRSAVETAVYL